MFYCKEPVSASEELSAQSQTLMEQVDVLSKQIDSNDYESSATDDKTHFGKQDDNVKPTRSNGNENEKRSAQHQNPSNAEALIPMGENRISEHDESMSDF